MKKLYILEEYNGYQMWWPMRSQQEFEQFLFEHRSDNPTEKLSTAIKLVGIDLEDYISMNLFDEVTATIFDERNRSTYYFLTAKDYKDAGRKVKVHYQELY